jgi:hypothetical protein
MVLISLAIGAALATISPDRDKSLRAFLQKELVDERNDMLASGRSDPGIRYAASFVDLNGDGHNEALVYLMGRNICGSSGCELYIYTPAGDSWREVSEVGLTQLPVQLLPTSHHGWKDLVVFVSGGGVLPGYYVRLQFNGRSYPDSSNDLRSHKRATGRVLISRKNRGRPLY